MGTTTRASTLALFLLGSHVIAERDPLCFEPAQSGRHMCRGFFPRFTWSQDKGCHSIIYGGCGGGRNLFVTVDECEAACGDDTSTRTNTRASTMTTSTSGQTSQEEVCDMPPVWPGPIGCLAMMKKWTFSTPEGRCVPYTYGGCRGTQNLFSSEAECTARCPSKSKPSAEVCALPLQPGQGGAKPVYAFNSRNNRCEGFLWGVEGGNENRFSTLEDCVASCGGGRPQERAECHQVECDQREEQLSLARGCRPITKPGDCCPSSWDCSLWEERKSNNSMCFFSSALDPAGKFYAINEQIPAVSDTNGCRQAAICVLNSNGNAEILTASVDCPQFFRSSSDPSCRSQYSSHTQCCSTEEVCGEEVNSLPTCSLDGQTFRKGQKMYPNSHPCLVCICQEGWTGQLEAPMCQPIDCGLQLAGDKVLRGCTPIHSPNSCCPRDWVCPGETPTTVISTRSSTSSSSPDVCQLPKDIGPCRRLMPSFYFDSAAGQCKQFNYGGCKGNGNRFSTLEECRTSCGSKSPMMRTTMMSAGGPLIEIDRCNLPQEAGPCRAARPSWSYDRVTRECQPFLYGGCRGNANRFETLGECQTACVNGTSGISTLPAPAPPRRAGGGFMLGGGGGGVPGGHSSVPIDKEVKMVAAKGSKTLLTTSSRITGSECPHAQLLQVLKAETQVVAGTNFRLVLKIRRKTGPSCSDDLEQICTGVMYHRPIGCSESDYSSCLQLIREDDITCAQSSMVKVAPLSSANEDVYGRPRHAVEAVRVAALLREVDPCHEEKKVGPCKAAIPRFFFDGASGSCSSFTYGGCRGNGNNFASQQECEAKCISSRRSGRQQDSDPCSLPMDGGPCRALKPRFYHNAGKCEQFIYGGCRGNENNFASLEACQARCVAGRQGAAEEAKCQHGDQSFNRGDIVKLANPGGSGCRSCVCSTPPLLTCREMVCPMRMFTPPAGGQNCVLQKDRFGCCDTGYKCDRVVPPAPQSLGGGVPGGYRREALSAESKKVAAYAMKSALSKQQALHKGCDRLTLLEVLEVHRQIVAGTNFKMKLRLRNRVAPECRIDEVRVCEVVIFRPLPHTCKQRDGCLQVPEPATIVCES